MARASGDREFNNFSKGFVTEASLLDFPENACRDILNFKINRNGSLSKRPGFNLEPGDLGYAIGAFSRVKTLQSYLWRTPFGTEILTYLVIRHGTSISLFDTSVTPLFGTPTYTASGVVEEGVEVDFATANGDLIVACGKENVLKIKMVGAGSFSQSTFKLTVRDQWGVDDGLSLTARPTTLSNTHRYNLYNQGWPSGSSGYSSYVGGLIYTVSVLSQIRTTFGAYPSNSDSFASGYDTGSKAFVRLSYLAARDEINVQVKGRYILDLFNRGSGRTRAGVTDLSVGGVTSVASFGGRLFYGLSQTALSGGDKYSPNLNTHICFSQTLTDGDRAGKCYQEADPTSVTISDIIDTDGGIVHIPEMDRCIRLVEMFDSLFIFASNGIWRVQGRDGIFSPTEYSVSRVSKEGIVGKSSLVIATDGIFFWSSSGIMLLALDNVTGEPKVENITRDTIAEYILSFSEDRRRGVRGAYDSKTQTVHWLIPTADNDGLCKEELILDIPLGAFYKYEIAPTSIYGLVSIVDLPGTITASVDDAVVIGTDPVVIGTDPVVLQEFFSSERVGTSFRYIVSFDAGAATEISSGFYFEDFFNRNMADNTAFNASAFYDFDTDDYEAYVETGYDFLSKETMRKKQAVTLVTHFKPTERFSGEQYGNVVLDESGCIAYTGWDTYKPMTALEAPTGTALAARYSSFPAYKPSVRYGVYGANYYPGATGYDINTFAMSTSQRKVRGIGRCLGLTFSSPAGKGCELQGWSINFVVNETP